MSADRAAKNKAIRQEALRQQLSAQGHHQHVVECANEIGKQGIERDEVYRLKTKADIHMALLDKYLPSLKAIEVSQGHSLEDADDIDLDAAIRTLAAETGTVPTTEGKVGETTH